MSDRSLIDKARKLGREYVSKYGGCAPTTLMAVADTICIDVSEDVFKSVIGFSSFTGGCGGMCGAASIIGLLHSQDKKEYLENRDISKIIKGVKHVQDRFIETYGSYLCYDIQKKLFGRSYNVTIPEEAEAFWKADPSKKCPKVTENAAGWAVEAILELDKP